MPEGSDTTSTTLCGPAIDDAVYAVFEESGRMVKLAEEGERLNELIVRAQNDSTYMPSIEDTAPMIELSSVAASMGDWQNGNNLIPAMADVCKGRRIFINHCNGSMGNAPEITMPCDKICVIPGCCAVRDSSERESVSARW